MEFRLLAFNLCANEPDFTSWLHRAESLRGALAPAIAEPVLELAARRAAQEGHLPDNPPLDQIDALVEFARARGFGFVSLALPVDLEKTGEALGFEISAVNGWTDIAAYMNIAWIRVGLTTPCDLAQPVTRDALRQILDYMRESELNVALSAPDAMIPALETFLKPYQSESGSAMGWDIPWPPETPELAHPAGGGSVPVVALHLPLFAATSHETIHQSLSEIATRFGEKPPAVVFVEKPPAR